MKIAVLVSGNGSNLQALIDNEIPISLVISSKRSAYALTRAYRSGINSEVVEWEYSKNHKNKNNKNRREAYSERILDILLKYDIDLVVYAGFTVILDRCVCQYYQNAMINVHPSLIPSFCGEGFYGIRVHEAALARGVKITGATVHYVNEICDGGPIILQKAVEVLDGDTPYSLQKRVMEIEREILPQAVKELIDINKIDINKGELELE